jgi:hypothetical protein
MGLFGKKKPQAPILENNRIWIGERFGWLFHEFKDIPIEDRKIYLPLKEDFPVKFEDNPNTAEEVVRIVANAMSIEFDKLKLHTFSNGIREFNFGTSRLFTGVEESGAAGTYMEDEDGFFNISIDRALLSDGETLIATVAHELAHVKLLGEKRIEENDEELTDLTTVFFGFGLFNANCSSKFKSNIGSWGYSALGYLAQNEWGYALAILAYCRGESEPAWIEYLNKQSQSDFKNSMEWILANEELVWGNPNGENKA